MTTRARVASDLAQEALVLRLSGAVDGASGPAVAEELRDAVAVPPPPALVVLDLRQVDLLTADGVRTLRAFAGAAAGTGTVVRVVAAPGGAVAHALGAGGRDLAPFADLDQALTSGTARPDVDMGLLSTRFEALTRTLLGDTTVADTLRHVMHAARLVIPRAALVSVTLRAEDGTFHPPLGTSEAARKLDEVQYRTGLGPCLTAAEPGGPAYAISPDLRAETRWPEFSSAAVDLGYRAVVATTLLPAGGPAGLSGALNIYSREPHVLALKDRHVALLLATHASLALAHVQGAELARFGNAELRRAIDSRDVIGQAKGILMHRQGISADDAFELLRRASQDLNVKLVDIAAALAARPSSLDPPAPRPGHGVRSTRS